MRFDLSPAKIPTGSAAPGSDAPQLGSAPYDTDSSKAWLRSFLLSEADVSNVAAARAELVKPIPRMRVDVDLARHASQAKLFTFEAPAHAATADGAAACSTIVKRLALWLMRAVFLNLAGVTAESVVLFVHDLTGAVWTDMSALDRDGSLRLKLGQHTLWNKCQHSGATTLATTWPDVCVWCREALLLKGEHKASGALRDAVDDLAMKGLDWRVPGLRELPFLPCYVAAGPLVQFKALMPADRADHHSMEATAAKLAPADATACPSQGSGTLCADLSRVFDMSRLDDRFDLLAASFNMFRAFSALAKRLPAAPVQLYRIIKCGTSLGGRVEVLGDRVVKHTKLFAPVRVYELLQDNAIPGAIGVSSFSVGEDGTAAIEMQPVCVQRLPQSVHELQDAARCVLTALNALHINGFVHRDIRWPNVLRGAADGRWRLIDFELAAPLDGLAPADASELNQEYLPPEVAAGEAYAAAGDVYQVGKLVADAGRRLACHAAVKFAASLTADEPDGRPTAAQALQHEWLRLPGEAAAGGAAVAGGAGAAAGGAGAGAGSAKAGSSL